MILGDLQGPILVLGVTEKGSPKLAQVPVSSRCFRTCFEHVFETLSGEVFESIGPPFRELLATILETFWKQREQVKIVLSLQSEPS